MCKDFCSSLLLHKVRHCPLTMVLSKSFSSEPADKRQFTEDFDRAYSRWAGWYDTLVKVLPFWRTWLQATIPHLQGPKVLEVSFGTGWLLTQIAGQFDSYGLDYNLRMCDIAKENLQRKVLPPSLMFCPPCLTVQ